ncbi:MAG: hypothetical protein WC707_02015 [Candidatus Babeliaceae bacterium]|jgi:hypothetical protein
MKSLKIFAFVLLSHPLCHALSNDIVTEEENTAQIFLLEDAHGDVAFLTNLLEKSEDIFREKKTIIALEIIVKVKNALDMQKFALQVLKEDIFANRDHDLIERKYVALYKACNSILKMPRRPY